MALVVDGILPERIHFVERTESSGSIHLMDLEVFGRTGLMKKKKKKKKKEHSRRP
jgi:hypothetical protein